MEGGICTSELRLRAAVHRGAGRCLRRPRSGRTPRSRAGLWACPAEVAEAAPSPTCGSGDGCGPRWHVHSLFRASRFALVGSSCGAAAVGLPHHRCARARSAGLQRFLFSAREGCDAGGSTPGLMAGAANAGWRASWVVAWASSSSSSESVARWGVSFVVGGACGWQSGSCGEVQCCRGQHAHHTACEAPLPGVALWQDVAGRLADTVRPRGGFPDAPDATAGALAHAPAKAGHAEETTHMRQRKVARRILRCGWNGIASAASASARRPEPRCTAWASGPWACRLRRRRPAALPPTVRRRRSGSALAGACFLFRAFCFCTLRAGCGASSRQHARQGGLTCCRNACVWRVGWCRPRAQGRRQGGDEPPAWAAAAYWESECEQGWGRGQACDAARRGSRSWWEVRSGRRNGVGRLGVAVAGVHATRL